MRILHVAHQQIRKYGRTRVSWAQKLYCGLIKNNHNVQSFSDRDIASFEAPFGFRELGKKAMNRRLLETAEAFVPDLVIIGHCDHVSNHTLTELRMLVPGVVIAACNNDPLFVPENRQKILHRCEAVDAHFVSTGQKELSCFENINARMYHMPNPVDPAIEVFNVSEQDDFTHDLLFCSKSDAHSERQVTVDFLRRELPASIRFHTPGNHGVPGVWGREYDLTLSKSKMGLNLNRQEIHEWYSSARMAQMAGNGLLVFTHAKAGFDRLLPKESLVYFSDAPELSELVIEFHNDDEKRKAWAANSYQFFHREMNNTLFAQYIVEQSLELPFSHPYAWHLDD